MLCRHTTSFQRKANLDLVLIQFVFVRVGLTAAMRTYNGQLTLSYNCSYWNLQLQLLENSIAIHTGFPVSERSAAKGATRQQLLHAYIMPSLCY